MSPELFDALARPSSAAHFASALNDISGSVGLAHFLIVRLRGPDLAEAVQCVHNAPLESQEAVQALRHWSIARMLDRMRAGGPPVVFGQGDEPALALPGYTSGVGAFARERRGACVLYLGCDAQALPPELVMPAVQAAVLGVQYALSGMAALHVAQCPLSERERACLQLFMAGQSARQMAQGLNLSPRTVENHLASVRKRCGAETTIAAVYHAIHQGWIAAPDDAQATAAAG
jgi:DNA-binding CsgD family transcriptional regulator